MCHFLEDDFIKELAFACKGILQKIKDTESEFEDTGKQHRPPKKTFLFKAFI